MVNDDLIQKGNILMAAANAGKIGLSVDELRALQKWYIRDIRTSILGMLIGILASFFCGLVSLINSDNFRDTGSLIFGGAFVLFSFGVVLLTMIMKKYSRCYEALVNQEYPRLPKDHES